MIWPRSRACAASFQRIVSSHLLVRVVSEFKHSGSQESCWLVPMSATGQQPSSSILSLDRQLTANSGYSSLVGSLLQCYVDTAGFSRTSQVPLVHLGDHLLYRSRHGLETSLSTTVNGDGAFKRNHVTVPVGAFPVEWAFCSLDRYDLVGLSRC